MPSLPPVLVADEAELAASAERTVLVERLRTLVAWLGKGRALTAANRLRVADARELAGLLGMPVDARVRGSADLPEVSLLVEWAKGVRLVRTVKGRLVPVKRAAGLTGSPLEPWRLAFEAFPSSGSRRAGPGAGTSPRRWGAGAAGAGGAAVVQPVPGRGHADPGRADGGRDPGACCSTSAAAAGRGTN